MIAQLHARAMIAATVLAFLLPNSGWAEAAAPDAEYDVVVYGATPGGICAAVAAARQGAEVALVEPTGHVGGLMSGGLSFSDSNQCDRRTLGGLFEEIHTRIAAIYRQRGVELPYDVAVKDQARWTYEPHVAQQVFDELLEEAKVKVIRDAPATGIATEGNRIISLTTTKGDYLAKQYVDATYEGDLMALAGVTWTLGRESKEAYGESLAGHQYPKRRMKSSPRDAQGKLLPLMTAESPGKDDGDRRVMTYSFRLCLSNDPANRVEVTKPAEYDPARFELARRAIAEDPKCVMLDLYQLPIPGKFDGNNGIAKQVSLGLIEAGSEWAEASWERRREIWQAHKEYTLEFLWFLQHDPSVPEDIRERMQPIGLAKDEFADSGHWPPALYVREARRMVGRYVMTQDDVRSNIAKDDSIGVGSFPIDSHDCQRVATKAGGWVNEGTIMPERLPAGYGQPHQLPYRSITPHENECANLLVPVCLSATHVAFSSVRVEPTWMVLGQSAGMAAAMAAETGAAVQQLLIKDLQQRLVKAGQVLDLQP
jgi:hypothetical protein